MSEFNRRALNILISLDQFLFSMITFGNSNPDETMSSAAYRLEQSGRWQGRFFRPLIDRIFLHAFGQKAHCESAWLTEHKSEVWRGIDQ